MITIDHAPESEDGNKAVALIDAVDVVSVETLFAGGGVSLIYNEPRENCRE
jgi:hypothetical protein